jgi:glyoxylase-like metal-dependent hydrolase (beta-lactamase superfamily II)
VGSVSLPDAVRVLERGWLSSNNVVCLGDAGQASVIDTGYGSHADQTVALVSAAIGGRTLSQIACTHLHSDHCGGVAALTRAYPSAGVWIPPGEAGLVREWDAERLSYAATGQLCERFRYDSLLEPGSAWIAGTLSWQVLAAPGHDPHSVILYEPHWELLVSADALWENGFGVVFPAIEGVDAFGEVRDTLNLIAGLR